MERLKNLIGSKFIAVTEDNFKVQLPNGEFRTFEFVEDGDRVNIAFFGESKKIMDIDSFSSSESGWSYGACVWLNCEETKDYFDLTQW